MAKKATKKATSSVRPADPVDLGELGRAASAMIMPCWEWMTKGGGAFNLADRRPADVEFLAKARNLVDAMSNALAAVEARQAKGQRGQAVAQ